MYAEDILTSVEKAFVVVLIASAWAALISGALSLQTRFSGIEMPNKLVLCAVSLVFGGLALVMGLITGASRSAAVGDVIPAALAFIGGVALYVITQAKSERATALVAVVSFSVLLMLGVVLGSFERLRSVAYQEALKYDLQTLKAQADAEFAINGYRRSRGLPEISLSE